jgi:hypothetical protein
MTNSTDTTQWTAKQRAAYEALKASIATNEAQRINQPSIMNKVPQGGWTTEDRVGR